MRLPFVLLTVFAACAQFPELEGTVTPEMADRRPPVLVPLNGLLERATANRETFQITAGNITNRVTALQSRATRLRGPVIDQTTRARMLSAIRLMLCVESCAPTG